MKFATHDSYKRVDVLDVFIPPQSLRGIFRNHPVIPSVCTSVHISCLHNLTDEQILIQPEDVHEGEYIRSKLS